jgi:SAM-dependent methyltransferase
MARTEASALAIKLSEAEHQNTLLQAEIERQNSNIDRLKFVIDSTPAESKSLRENLAQVPPDRPRDLKRTYVAHVDRLKRNVPHALAMESAVGGDSFEEIGNIEVAILRYYGLRPNDHLIDVGCGSGRLAKPLATYLTGKYSGFDVVDDLVDYAKNLVPRPDWRFEAIDHIGIPEPDSCANMVCFFSVMTHLLHEHSYWYLEECKRVLKPGGQIVLSFIEFGEPDHWAIFEQTLSHAKGAAVDPLNVFLESNVLRLWAVRLGLEIVDLRDGNLPGLERKFGHSLCVLRVPE